MGDQTECRAVTKHIRLRIEWDGACGEETWADIVKDTIEAMDSSGTMRVMIDPVMSHYGVTAPLPKAVDLRTKGITDWATGIYKVLDG